MDIKIKILFQHFKLLIIYTKFNKINIKNNNNKNKDIENYSNKHNLNNSATKKKRYWEIFSDA